MRVRPRRRPARPAGKGGAGRAPAERPPTSDVPGGRSPGRLTRRVRRGDAGRGGDRPPRPARRRPPGPLAAPGPLAPLPGPRLPARAHGGGGADGPVHPRRPDTGGAGGPYAGVAEGALRVGAEPLLQAGPHHVARGGDRPGGHHPAQGRGAAGQGETLSRLAVGHAPCQGRGVAQGDDPAGEGPLRRDARQAGQPGLPPARGASLHAAPGPERRGRVAQPRHVQHRPALPLLAARHGHPQRHPLRHRHAGLLPRRLRPLGRDAPQRQHRRPRTVGIREIIRHQARRAQGIDQGHHRLRHRPRGGVRGHGEGSGRTGAVPRSPGRGHEPLRDRQGRLRGASPAHRQPAPPHRGDGRREPGRGAPGPPSITPWRATTPSHGSAPASGTSTSICKRARRETPASHGC